jgi:hypothetical protein
MSRGQLDNQKCQIIQKTNEKDKGKYQLSFNPIYIIKSQRKYNMAVKENNLTNKNNI